MIEVQYDDTTMSKLIISPGRAVVKIGRFETDIDTIIRASKRITQRMGNAPKTYRGRFRIEDDQIFIMMMDRSREAKLKYNLSKVELHYDATLDD